MLYKLQFEEEMQKSDKKQFDFCPGSPYDELIKNGPVITYSHLEIAKYLGSAREVVSRMLKYFEKEGILTVSRKEIVITDKKGLFEHTK